MKQDLLKNAGYRYNFDRMVYVNRAARKAFSVEFVDDNPEDVIARCIQENGEPNGWHFYFNSPPSESVRRQLERALG